MRGFLVALFASLTTWWGLGLLAALDSTIVFFLPLGVDIAVVIVSSRSHDFFWFYPLLAATGSICGAAVTFYIGRRLGEPGLEHYISRNRLARLRKRIEEKGAVSLAVLDLIPPPFPFTACILAAGALEVSTPLFFSTLFVTRVLRFEVEAVLAHLYGRQIIGWLQSTTSEYIGLFFVVVVAVGTVVTIIQLVGKTRIRRTQPRRAKAA